MEILSIIYRLDLLKVPFQTNLFYILTFMISHGFNFEFLTFSDGWLIIIALCFPRFWHNPAM